MEEDEFYKKRGQIISNFAFVESTITQSVVANYFTSEQTEQLTAMSEDIFENKFISFEAKKTMLKTVLKKYHPKIDKEFPWKNLEDMQTIRNRLAHGVFQSKAQVVQETPLKYKIIEFQVRHNGEDYIAADLFEQYEAKKTKIEDYIRKLPGVTMIKADTTSS